MISHTDRLRKEIQKIIYQDLEVWKQHINDLEAKKIDLKSFKGHYVEFLQKIEDSITHFTQFFLKKEAHLLANQILEDDMEKTALLETIIEFLSIPNEETEIVGEIIHKKFLPSANISPMKDDKSLIYPASEIE